MSLFVNKIIFFFSREKMSKFTVALYEMVLNCHLIIIESNLAKFAFIV